MKTTIILLTLMGALVFTARAQETKPVSPYPLTTCIVSGEELGSMGETIAHVHGDREIKFCCRKCLKKFMADPDKYLALIDRATKAQSDAAMKNAGGHPPHDHSQHHE